MPLAPVDTDPTKDENLLFINKLNMHAALQSSMQQQVVAYNIKKSSVLGSIKEAFEVTPTQNRTLENKLSELDLDELNNLMKR